MLVKALGLLAVLAISFSGHAIPSDGGEFSAQQAWMAESHKLWNDFGVQANALTYSSQSLVQLRTLYDALRNNQPVNVDQYDQIRIACKRAECR